MRVVVGTAMNIELIGFLLDGLGKILVSYTAISVHYRFWKAHKITEEIFDEMKREQRIGIVGVILIIVGIILEIPGHVS